MKNIPKSEHPRPDLWREDWLSLNGEWDFETDNSMSGTARGFAERDSFEGKITVPFCPESSLSGVCNKDFMSSVWYRREFSLPADWSGKRIILHTGACDYHTTVYVNGKKAGEHKGGYTPFSFDVTALLKDGLNAVTVHAVDDLRSEMQVSGKQSPRYESYGCMYTRTTGIWQTVWLEAVNDAHVVSFKAYPCISDPSVTLSARLSKGSIGAALTVEAFYEGRAVGKASTEVVSTEATLTLALSEKHLWEVGNGRLYDLVFTLEKDGRTDIMHSYFGLRQVALTKEKGLMINGKTVFGRFVLDQGFYPDGIYTAPSDEALVFDIKASMACGFNGARLHQKVFEPRFLYHADRLGYMVWAETGNWGLDHTLPESIYNFLPEWLEEMDRDFSHPSVIGWCPFNETWDKNGRCQSNSFIDTVYDVTKALDPTRPVIANSGSYPTSRTDVHDVHDYEQDPTAFYNNYKDADKNVVNDQLMRQNNRRQFYRPELPIFVSEYGGIKWVDGADDTAWGYGKDVKSEEEFFERLKGLTDALLDNKAIFGFCYTQLTDVEQEQNGLLTYDRRFKFDPERYRSIIARQAKIEKD